MQLANLITPDVVKSYARAAIAVARRCDRLSDEGYRVLVVPSRGAVPVVETARAYRRTILNPMISRQTRLELMMRNFSDPLSAAVHIPFTADMGETGVKGLETAAIRGFWARVVAAIARGQTTGPYYEFYRFHRDVVCKVGHHDNLEHRLDSERFVFIDTVVSGRAVVEIAAAFDALGMDQIHYILLIDENGARIDPRYASALRRLEGQGRATLINVDRLFTEDQGPGACGVWSVVMPNLMEAAREIVPEFSDGVVGAGIYYHEVASREDESNLDFTIAIGRLHTLLHQTVHVVADEDEVAEDLERLGLFFDDTLKIDAFRLMQTVMARSLDHQIAVYVEHLDDTGLFDASATHAVALKRVLSGAKGRPTLDVSGSHCLRLDFAKDEAARLMRAFQQGRSGG